MKTHDSPISTGWHSAILILLMIMILILPVSALDPPDFISKYDYFGKECAKSPSFFSDVTKNQSGNLYIIDSVFSKVHEITPDGICIREWGSLGNGPGQFNYPMGITTGADGTVYVADSSNNRIQAFDSEGKYLRQWGSLGINPGEFWNPNDVAVGPDGNVYVADTVNNRTQVFAPDGTFLRQWGIPADEPDKFLKPQSITVDSQGSVYVGDSFSGILKFTSSGSYVTKVIPLGILVKDVTADADNRIYVTGHDPLDSNVAKVQIFSKNGVLLTEWASWDTAINAKFILPQGIAVDSDGYIYVTDAGKRIVKFLVLPEKFDYRNFKGKNWMTSVKNQGKWGACWAFATNGAIEARYNLERGSQQNLDLSEWDLHYLLKSDKDEGATLLESYNTVKKFGIVEESCAPFNWESWTIFSYPWGRCSFSTSDMWTFDKQFTDDFPVSAKILKNKLLTKGPLSIQVPWGEGHHAIVLVGWNDEKESWIIKNSWGNKTNPGYALMSYKTLIEGSIGLGNVHKIGGI